MQFYIKQAFLGIINGTEIKDEIIYNHTIWFFQTLEERFNCNPTKEMVEIYAREAEAFINDNEENSLAYFENELYYQIEQAEKLEDLRLEVWQKPFDETNQAITKKSSYTQNI